MGSMFQNWDRKTSVITAPSGMVGRGPRLGADVSPIFAPSGMFSIRNGQTQVVSPASGMIGNGSYISGRGRGPRVHGRASNR